MISLKRYDWVLHMLTIAFCSYFLAQAIATYVGGILEAVSESQESVTSSAEKVEKKEVASVEDFQGIVERNIFNSSSTGENQEVSEEGVSLEQTGELGPAVKTSLDIKVLGTLVVGEGTDRRSSVVISGGKESKGMQAYYPGDEKTFSPNVKLTKIAKDRIEFINGNRLEFAELEDFAAKKSIFASAEDVHGKGGQLSKTDSVSPATVTSEGGKIVLDQKEIDDALQNLDKLMTEIRIVPYFKEGKAQGMKVLSVKPGSVLGKLGIKRGDVLAKVNGQDLDMKQGMELFGQLKDMKNFALDVVRGGKNQTFEYEIR